MAFTSVCLAQHSLDFYIPPCDPVGSEQNKTADSDFNVYPNPASDNFIVELYNHNNAEIVSFEIYNILGKLVSEKELKIEKGSNSIEIDVSDLDSGTYILKFIICREIIHKKIIVQ